MTKPMPKALKLKMEELATKAAFTKYKDAPGGSVSDHDHVFFCKGFQAMYELALPLVEVLESLADQWSGHKFEDGQLKPERHNAMASLAKAALKQFREDGDGYGW